MHHEYAQAVTGDLEVHFERAPRLEAPEAQIVPAHVEDLPAREQRVAVAAVVTNDRCARHGLHAGGVREKLELSRIAVRAGAAVHFLQPDRVAFELADDVRHAPHVAMPIRPDASVNVVRGDPQRLVRSGRDHGNDRLAVGSERSATAPSIVSGGASAMGIGRSRIQSSAAGTKWPSRARPRARPARR